MCAHVVAAAVLAVLVTGCGTSTDDASDTAADTSQLGHVHGLGTNPTDGALFVATHFGVFRVDESGQAHRVADRFQDTMAFTVVGADHFLASGHPDLSADLPTHLGLIESTDAAESWSIRSLGGEADFHALDVTGDRIFGFDSLTGRLLTTTDPAAGWATLGRGNIVDLAADPADPNHVLVTSPEGTLASFSTDGETTGPTAPGAVEGPPVVLIDWPEPDLLVGVTADGHVHRSRDQGGSWTAVTAVPGMPQALDVTAKAWHLATDAGVYESIDEGRSWQLVVRSH